MPVDSSPETAGPPVAGAMERTPLSAALSVPETLRVRCPHCRKLYLVQLADIQESKPRFECVQCRSRFWLSLSEMDLGVEVFGLPLQVREVPSRPKKAPGANACPCPKCSQPVEAGSEECPACGVLIEKFRNASAFVDGVPPHSPTLSALWKRLAAEYFDERLHGEFIKACQRERNLTYAASQYARMARLMPSDEVTERRIREIQALASTMIPRSGREGMRVPRPYLRLWNVPFMGAVIVVIVGMVVPMFRNLVGVGAGLIFLAAALQIHFRRP